MLTEHGTTKAVKKTKLDLKDIDDIWCIRIAIFENKPLKIKSIDVETTETRKQKLTFKTNSILKCGEYCSVVFCKDANALKEAEGADDEDSNEFKKILK